MPLISTADIATKPTYTWTNAGQTILKREDADGIVTWVPADPDNRDYAEFLSSGATADPYVAPPVPPEPTLTEKLANVGIDLDELKALLAA